MIAPKEVGEHIQVHGILKDGAPVFLLVDAFSISFGKGRVVVQLWACVSFRDANDEMEKTDGGDCQTELTHGVKSGRASVQELFDEFGDGSSGGPVL